MNVLEIKRLESNMERLRSDLRYYRTQNDELKLRMKDLQRSEETKNLSKKYEAEKAKNLYLENENMQLRRQIRELNGKYKLFIDDKNRQTVGQYVGRRTVNAKEVEGMRAANSGLKRENRDLRERLQSMGNELKMKSNISEAVSKKEFELDALRSDMASLSQENGYLQQKIMRLEMEVVSLKEELRVKDMELGKVGNDRMVKTYQKLYNDMKRECEIYMEKVNQLTLQLQRANSGHQVTYTKNVYQSGNK